MMKKAVPSIHKRPPMAGAAALEFTGCARNAGFHVPPSLGLARFAAALPPCAVACSSRAGSRLGAVAFGHGPTGKHGLLRGASGYYQRGKNDVQSIPA